MGRRSRRFIVMMPGIVVLKLNKGGEQSQEQRDETYVALDDFATSSPLNNSPDGIETPIARQITSTATMSAIRSDILLYDYLKENTILLTHIKRFIHHQMDIHELNKIQFPRPSAAIIGYGEGTLKSGTVSNNFPLVLEVITRIIRGNFTFFSLMFGVDLHLPHAYAASSPVRVDLQSKYAALPPAILDYSVKKTRRHIPLILVPIESLLFPTHLMVPGDYSSRSLFHPNLIRQLYLELLLQNDLLSENLLRFYTVSELSSAKLELQGFTEPNASLKFLNSIPELNSRQVLNKNVKGTRYTLSNVFSEDALEKLVQKCTIQGFEKDIYEAQEKNISINLAGGMSTYRRGRRRQSQNVSPQLLSVSNSTPSAEHLQSSKNNVKPTDFIKDISSLSFLQCINLLLPLRTTTDFGCIVFQDIQFIQPFPQKCTSSDPSEVVKSAPTSPQHTSNAPVFTVLDASQNVSKVISVDCNGGKLFQTSSFDLEEQCANSQVTIEKIVLSNITIVPSLPLAAEHLDELTTFKELEPYYEMSKLATVEYIVKVVLKQPIETYLQDNHTAVNSTSNTAPDEVTPQTSLTISGAKVLTQPSSEPLTSQVVTAPKASLRASQRSTAHNNENSDTNSLSSSEEHEIAYQNQRGLASTDSSLTREALTLLLKQKIDAMETYLAHYGNSVISRISPDFRTGSLIVGQASLSSISDHNIYTVSGTFDNSKSTITVHSQSKREVLENKSNSSLFSFNINKSLKDLVLKERKKVLFRNTNGSNLFSFLLPNSENLHLDLAPIENNYPSFMDHLILSFSLTSNVADKSPDLVYLTQEVTGTETLTFLEALLASWKRKSLPLSTLVGSLIDLSAALTSLFLPSPLRFLRLTLGARDLVLHDDLYGGIPVIYLVWGLSIPYMKSIMIRDRILCPYMGSQLSGAIEEDTKSCSHGFFEPCTCASNTSLDFLSDILNDITWLLVDDTSPSSRDEENTALSSSPRSESANMQMSTDARLALTLKVFSPPPIINAKFSSAPLSIASIFSDYEELASPAIVYLSDYKQRCPLLNSLPSTHGELETSIIAAVLRLKLVDVVLFGASVQRTAIDIIRFEDKDLLSKAAIFLSLLSLVLNDPFRLPLYTPMNLRLQPSRIYLVPYAACSVDLIILDQEKKSPEYCASIGITIDPADSTTLRTSYSASTLGSYSQAIIPGLNTEIFASNMHMAWKITGPWKLQPVNFYINFQLYQFIVEGIKSISTSLSLVELLEQIITSSRLKPLFNISLISTLHDMLCQPNLFVPGMVYMPNYGYLFAKSLFDPYRAGCYLTSLSGDEKFNVAEYYGTIASISGFSQGLHCLYPTSNSLVSNCSASSLTGISALAKKSNTNIQAPISTIDLPNSELYGINDQEFSALEKETMVYSFNTSDSYVEQTDKASDLVISPNLVASTSHSLSRDARADSKGSSSSLLCLPANNVSYLLATKHLNEGVYTYDLQTSLLSSGSFGGQLSINLATTLLMTRLCNRKFPAFAKQLPSSHVLPATILDLMATSTYEQQNMIGKLQSLLDCGPERPILIVAKLPQKDDFLLLRSYEQVIKAASEDNDPIVPFGIWDDIYDFVLENQQALFAIVDNYAFDFDEDMMMTIEAAVLYDDIDSQTLSEWESDTERSYHYLQERRCGIYRTDEEKQVSRVLSKGFRAFLKGSDISPMLPNFRYGLLPIFQFIFMARPSAVSYGTLTEIIMWTNKDVIRLARCRGLEIGKNVLLGKIHPDSNLAGTKKHPSYESMAKVIDNYQKLTSRAVELGKTRILPIPDLSGSNAESDSAGIRAPLFQRYTLLEERGAAPLFDIAQRELRSTVPYTLCTEITVKNTPLVPEVENPPNPSAEDSTNTFLIDYWSISIPKCRHITPERIRSLWNPIWSLEERTLDIIPLDPTELINTQAEKLLAEEIISSDTQYNKLLGGTQGKSEQQGAAFATRRKSTVQATPSKCACGTFHAVLLPSQSSFPQQTLHQSIFSISPYYIPPDLGDDVSRDKIFTKLVLHATQEACLLIREYLDILVNANRNQISRSRHEAYKYIDEAVWAFILSNVPANESYKHIRVHVSPQVWERKSTSPKAIFGPYALPSFELQAIIGDRTVEEAVKMMRIIRKGEPHILCKVKDSALVKSVIQQSELNKYPPQIAISKGVDAWGTNFSLDERMADIGEFLQVLWQHYPLLNPLLIGDVENRFFQTPYCIASAYESGFASIHELEEARCIKFLLRQGRQLENEILDDLIASQEKLRILSTECMKRRLRAIKVLEIERYNDIVSETEELCALYINTVWGKANYTDKRNPGMRMTHEMQVMGAYESDGCVQNDNSEFLDLIEETIRANGLRLGPSWTYEGFDYRNIM